MWEKPEALVQIEASRMAAIHNQHMVKNIPLMQQPPLLQHHPHLQHPILPPQLGPPPTVMPPGAAWMQQVLVAEAQKRQFEERSKQEMEERNRSALAVQAAKTTPVDKSKPVSSTPITGTPWCVVWTGDGRVFFYNPSSKMSVWERPEELADRADVTKAMSTVPEALLASNPGNVVPRATTVTQHNTPGGSVGEETVSVPKAAECESEDEEEGFPSKKFKGEGELTLYLYILLLN